MNPLTQRSLEVDFFRGVVLLVIAVDHISGSVLSNFTLHKFAFCDSAEVFVFLGGYASAGGVSGRWQRVAARVRRADAFRRSWEIYRAYLFTAALMLLGGALLMLLRIDSPMLEYSEWPVFLGRPLDLIFEVAVLRHQAVFVVGIADVCAFRAGRAVRRAPRRTQAGCRAVRQPRHLAVRVDVLARAAFR